MNKPFEISTVVGGADYLLFLKVWNLGIDSRLEAFTKSDYVVAPKEILPRIYFYFAKGELQILLRRLYELAIAGDDLADSWETDILMVHYGIEI
jgi:hypothetical protein